MNAYAISGEIVERQFYIILWDRMDDDAPAGAFEPCQAVCTELHRLRVECELLPQKEIVRLCNLVNNPAYKHPGGQRHRATIPIITQ
jgi:hypothetical protein